MIRVHGTSVALAGSGILLRGPSGSGKSDLALRLLDEGGRLVADDQTELRRVGVEVILSAPATIAGRMEVRGVGILTVPSVPSAPLRLVVDLVASQEIERFPTPRFCDFLGRRFSVIALAPFEASAAAKLRLAIRAATAVTGVASASAS